MFDTIGTPGLWATFAAFVVAALDIKGFVGFLNKHGFKPFGWYRIGLGALLLALLWAGVDLRVI